VIPRLWYVTDGDRGTAGRDLTQVIEWAAAGGAGAVLLREFGISDRAFGELVERLSPARAAGLRVLVSRRLDLARAHDLDGVQLTADSVSVAEGRAWLGPEPWIGYSAHSPEEARAAERAGASYVMLSPIFATASKPGHTGLGLSALARTAEALAIPTLALGGVTPGRTRGILGTGAWGIAAVGALGAAARVTEAAQAFRHSLPESTSCTESGRASS